jgi:hypothetical protein
VAQKLHRMPDTSRNTGLQRFETVDFELVGLEAEQACVKTFELNGKPRTVRSSLLIVGGGLGGVASALAALRNNVSNVVLLEETSWLGGQMTAQSVSAPDENRLVETSGATRTYKRLREMIRNHYRKLGATDGGARFEPWLDPGNCWVSRLAFEPSVAVSMIEELMHPYTEAKQLRVFKRHKVLSVKVERKKIRSVLSVDLDTGKFVEIRSKFVLDATELGDLLPLTAVAYSSGAESRSETGEAHAPPHANPDNVQDFTYPFIVEFCPGQNHQIDKPARYDEFAKEGKFSLNGYRMFANAQVMNKSGESVELLPFWEYRRLIASSNFKADVFANDVSMINWDSNDLRGENIIDVPPQLVARRLAAGKLLSLGFLYWLQTEAPRDDGGTGYPELKLRADFAGTSDGLSKYPYIRESRRMKSRYRVVEADIANVGQNITRSKWFDDSVGIGHYPIDIHGHQDVPGAAQATLPFQIPAGALLQTTLKNFLPACKNIGTTHVTNGAYRLHPIEWAIGEAAGSIAALSLEHKESPTRLLANKRHLRELQQTLIGDGSPVVWFDDVPPECDLFRAAQYLAVSCVMPPIEDVLSFGADAPMQVGEAGRILTRITGIDHDKVGAGETLCASKLHQLAKLHQVRSPDLPPSDRPVCRGEFAVWLYRIVQSKRAK